MRWEEAVLVRIFFGEDDRWEGKPLYKHITEFCRERGVAGVTVFRGILGYGKSSVIHEAKLFKLSSDLPIVVEIIDSEEKLSAILPELKNFVKNGIVTLERVKVLRYN